MNKVIHTFGFGEPTEKQNISITNKTSLGQNRRLLSLTY
jgi:hypothetical protein